MLRPVENHFSPLTPKHGFPSLIYKTQGAPPQPATCVEYRLPFRMSKSHSMSFRSVKSLCNCAILHNKTGENRLWIPPAKGKYHFLRRHYPHQVIGSKVHPSSQPVNTSSPVFFSCDGMRKSSGISAAPEAVKTKTGDIFPDASGRKAAHDDFLRRHYPHQVKGSKLITSSQPACTSSPVLFAGVLYIVFVRIASALRRNISFRQGGGQALFSCAQTPQG